MDLTSFQGLMAAIGDVTGRDGMSTRLAVFVSLAEAKFARVLRTIDMESEVTLTTAADGSVLLPADFQEVRKLFTLGDTGATLDYLPPDVAEVSNSGMADGVLAYGYTTLGGKLWLVPGAAGQVRLIYTAKFTPLSPSAPKNWLLQQHPDVYLYGTLAEYAKMTGDAADVDWGANCASAIDDLITADKRKRWGSGRVVPPYPTP